MLIILPRLALFAALLTTPAALATEYTEVENATAAIEEVRARKDAFVAEKTRIYTETGKIPPGSAPVERITWPYGPCTDAESLMPPPPEGWGFGHGVASGESQVAAERGNLYYTSFDETLEPGSDEEVAARKSLLINIASDSPMTASLERALGNEMLRGAMFEPGPFGYPVMKGTGDALLDGYLVQIHGAGADSEAPFLETILRCAIDGGLVAKQVDPATPKDTP